MTFGVGSPGFDPFWCPPCNEGVCNVVCLDPIDGPLLLLGILATALLVRYATLELLETEEEQ